jgi:hypothetical protein
VAGQEHSVEVDAHDLPPLREVQVLPGDERYDRGVVHQDVDLAVTADGTRYEVTDLGRIADIGDVRGAGDVGGGLDRRLFVDIGDDHGGAFGCEFLGDGTADTLTRAGHYGNATFELHSHPSIMADMRSDSCEKLAGMRVLRAGAIIAVSDLTKSLHFYRDQLGLAPDAVYDDPPYATLACAGARISLAQQGFTAPDRPGVVMTAPGDPSLASVVLIMEVDDADAARELLGSCGVTFS